ncbi:hypothetical protein [Sphaerospermopsis torques-reginae]|uniref:Inactive STAND domain-containing protein n=1 Tax=Sphaerospermopsis torques-reginae ITEP-024 TaxID=984208 RepID=A0ABX8WZE8_9CYAN|nr:hypothetical protein [Sphaerospermopsis torques-reginae]QYX31561.1 hypothetical protein K2F26_22655 [Sphaerospermopsis torques-reginae ITEP-024]
MEKKLQASKGGKVKIETKIGRGTDFSTTEDSKAISEANKIAFKWYAQKILKKNDITEETTLTLEELNSLKKEIYPQSSTGNSSYTQINNFINTLKRKQIKECTVQEVYAQEINVKGINYANWQKFYNGNPIPEVAFKAFCQVLHLDPNDIADKSESGVSKSDSATELEEQLKLFNHEPQIDTLANNVSEGRVFLISNDCLYGRSWMLHRLEKAIKTCFDETKINKCSVITLNEFSQNTHTPVEKTINDWKSNFHKHKIYDKLKKEHIIIVVNVDYYCYDLSSFQKICNFYKTMYEARSPDNPGHLLMFLLATDKNLQNQLQNGSYIHENIIELPKADYHSSHLMNLKLPDMQESIAKEIINKCQNNAQQLLCELYQRLNIPRDPTTLKIWSNYPWT